MTSRRVRNIAARKKQDTIFGAITQTPDAPGGAGLLDGTNYFLYNATYRLYQDHDNDHVRTTNAPYFVGVKDNVTLTSTFPYSHRRVTFWTHEQFAAGQPYVFESDIEGEPSYMRRPLERLDPETNSALFEYLFKGTLGVDYSEDTRHITPLDSRRLRIVSDVTTSVNPGVAPPAEGATYGGKIINKKLWHPIRETLLYDEDEDGASVSPNRPGFVSRSPNCPGNYYIMDIFSVGLAVPDPSLPIGSFSPQTTVYWHET